MEIFKVQKVIGSVPAQLEEDTIYFVRTGAGFDLYASDLTGSYAHKVNAGDINELLTVDLTDSSGISHLIVIQDNELRRMPIAQFVELYGSGEVPEEPQNVVCFISNFVPDVDGAGHLYFDPSFMYDGDYFESSLYNTHLLFPPENTVFDIPKHNGVKYLDGGELKNVFSRSGTATFDIGILYAEMGVFEAGVYSHIQPTTVDSGYVEENYFY